MLRADVFHRAGLIEKWGRGTNRVAKMCAAAGSTLPEFREITGAAVVTFRVPVAEITQSAGEVTRLLAALQVGSKTRKNLQDALGLRNADHFRSAYLMPSLKRRLVEMTIPDKPNSRLQKYQLTAAGRAVVAKR